MKKLFTSLLLLLSTHVMAEEPQTGQQFDAVAQIIPTDVPAKIEVMEIFWYGCIHCYQMENHLMLG